MAVSSRFVKHSSTSFIHIKLFQSIVQQQLDLGFKTKKCSILMNLTDRNNREKGVERALISESSIVMSSSLTSQNNIFRIQHRLSTLF